MGQHRAVAVEGWWCCGVSSQLSKQQLRSACILWGCVGHQATSKACPTAAPHVACVRVLHVRVTLYTDGPGRSLTLLTVLGTSGKTTTSWLIRGLLEQAGQLTGMVGSIEYALAEHLMGPEGGMWMPSEPDPAAGRECSSPFHLVPYKGRYCVEETTPSGLRVQVCVCVCWWVVCLYVCVVTTHMWWAWACACTAGACKHTGSLKHS